MEDTPQTNQPPVVSPQSSDVTPTGTPPLRSKPLIPHWAIAAVVVIVGTLAVLAAVGVFGRNEPIAPATVEITPTPTPTPIRTPSAIATSSAFLTLEEAVASLSAHIQAFPATDPSLSPPTLELELGFDE